MYAKVSRRFTAGLLLFVVSLGIVPATAVAASISQGFVTTEKIEPGALVSLNEEGGNQISLSDYTKVDNLLGVAVTQASSTIAVIPSGGRAQVATTGTAEIFVSTAAGAIKTGDPITASPTKGVAMRATQSGKIVGIAQSDFDGSGATTKIDLVNGKGEKTEVAVGKISVQIQVVYYVSEDEKSPIPPVVRGFATALAGKQVAPLRIMLAGGILLATIMASAIILFSSVRSSIISIGRNPLAQKQIYRGLIRVVVVALAILAVGVAAVYIVLKA